MAEIPHQIRIFGDRDKFGWADRDSARMIPADESFHSHDATGGELNYRLIKHLELAAAQSRAKFGFEFRAIYQRNVHIILKNCELVLALTLRRVHCNVGVAKECRRTFRGIRA